MGGGISGVLSVAGSGVCWFNAREAASAGHDRHEHIETCCARLGIVDGSFRDSRKFSTSADGLPQATEDGARRASPLSP
jgi:hypothetical protein